MAIGFEAARHLLSRTGIGTPPSRIAELAEMSRDEAVDDVLRSATRKAQTTAPAWVGDATRARPTVLAQTMDRALVRDTLREQGLELKQWWLRELVATRSPLTERMTLFWHGHFTSSLRKVKVPALLMRQNELLRAHALGSFDGLLRGILRDPAMLIYLDNVRNHATNPNENLAREVLELFTLGQGSYAEADVREAARALTGRGVSLRTGAYREAVWRHDAGEKVLFGARGAYDGEALVDAILNHPACAPFVASRIRGEFVTTPPDERESARLAAVFRRSGWSVLAVLEQVLVSEAFWAPSNRATRIKSPVELLVGTVRTLELEVPDLRALVVGCRRLGQDLFDPPNVKGWAGGTTWISSASLLRRVTALTRLGQLPTRIQRVEQWLGGAFAGRGELDRIAAVLNPLPPVNEVDRADVRRFVQGLLTDPTYQLG